MGHIYADHSSAAFSQGERFIAVAPKLMATNFACQVVLRIDQGKGATLLILYFTIASLTYCSECAD